jgi:hypothetical protein
MRSAFSSIRSAVAFALLLLFLLSLPLAIGKKLLPPRAQSYAAQSWGNGPYPYIQQQLFEEKGDIDIAFIGSSHILHCLDARRLQTELSRKLGRPATVRVIGWGGAGFDAIYFVAKDLLERRKVRTLVFYDDHNPENRNNKSPAWFRFSDDAAALTGLPLAEQGYFYFASLLGMPRNLLCLVRPNLPADLQTTNYWQTHYGSVNVAANLGSTASELGFTEIDADPTRPFYPFTPQNGVTADNAVIFSPTTQTNFSFASQPLPAWELHFMRLFADLARQHGTRLVLLNIPVLSDLSEPKLDERAFWPKIFGPNLVLLGVPPPRFFHGLTDADAHKLYFNPGHLNKNGQAYFTSLVLPDLLHIYETQPYP